ncbi:MAG: cell division protein ZapA [Bacteroidales bacterium]|nr:cell division protein ZapA [Bacteroidales bacterium]
MDTEKLNITLKIGEKSYPMKVNREDEEKFRQASKLAEEQFIKYKKAFANLPKEDILAMVILDLAKKNIDLISHKGNPEFFLELSDLVNNLGDYLKAQ